MKYQISGGTLTYRKIFEKEPLLTRKEEIFLCEQIEYYGEVYRKAALSIPDIILNFIRLCKKVQEGTLIYNRSLKNYNINQERINVYTRLPDIICLSENIYTIYKKTNDMQILSNITDILLDVPIRMSLLKELDNNTIIQESNNIVKQRVKIKNDVWSKYDNAKNALVKANLRLSLSYANKHKCESLSKEDLHQEGNAGLLKSIDKFNYRLGFKFSTYASWWIKQSIMKSVSECKIIRLPAYAAQNIKKIEAFISDFKADKGRAPSYKEISICVGIKVKDVLNLISISKVKSLDLPLKKDENSTVADIKESTDTCKPSDAVERKLNRYKCAEYMLVPSDASPYIKAKFSLCFREKQIIRMRYGIYDEKEYTLDEIAQTFDITRERVRQIEAEALKKMTEIAKMSGDFLREKYQK